MNKILEVSNGYIKQGIINRKVTEGKEIELVREYIGYRKEQFLIEKKMLNTDMAIFVEPKVDNSYPDIVFVEYNPDNYDNWKRCRNELCKDDLKILYHIYSKGGGQAEEIIKDLGISWKLMMTAIEKMYDADLIDRINKSWLIKDKNKIATYKIEAVEAKLNKWEQVLQQSIINKTFASESYALSEVNSMPRKEIIKKFKSFGVGVYLKKDNIFSTIKSAKTNPIPANFHSLFFNEWIGRILNYREEENIAIG